MDGNGVAEIIIGLGRRAGGRVEIFNGAPDGFTHRAWVQLPWAQYNVDNGETFPGAGDVDDDGIDEIVLGTGLGGDGWIAVLDDETHGFAPLRWLHLGWPAFNAANGETHPVVGNVDVDAAEEIVVGLGWSGGGQGGWFQIFDDLLANPGSEGMAWRQVPWPAYAETGGGTFPAVARKRGP